MFLSLFIGVLDHGLQDVYHFFCFTRQENVAMRNFVFPFNLKIALFFLSCSSSSLFSSLVTNISKNFGILVALLGCLRFLMLQGVDELLLPKYFSASKESDLAESLPITQTLYNTEFQMNILLYIPCWSLSFG